MGIKLKKSKPRRGGCNWQIIGAAGIIFLVLLIVASPALKAAERQEKYAPHYEIEVLRVIDGDSFKAEIAIWAYHTVVATIRLADIDTPELAGDCAEIALTAKAFTSQWLEHI